MKKAILSSFDLKTFSADILAKREKYDLSFGEVERTVGIRKAMLHSMERGDTYPNVKTFAVVVVWLGTNPGKYIVKPKPKK